MKLYGVELKNIKKHLGHEGEVCFSGTVYFNGKKLGTWAQDTWGGPDCFSFDVTSALSESFEKYKATLSDKKDESRISLRDIADCGLMLIYFIERKEQLKKFKKAIKKGYQGLVVIEGKTKSSLFYLHKIGFNDKEAFIKQLEKDPDIVKARAEYMEETTLRVYNCEADFDIL